MARPGRARVQRVSVHHAARGARDAHRARDLAARRAAGDPQAHCLQDRPSGAQRWSPVPPRQGGHADHGRRARAALHPDHHALVGGSLQPLRLVVLVVTFGFGAIGWIDDYRKVVKNNPKGLSPKAKFLWQSLIGLVAAVYLAFAVSAPSTAKVFDLFMAWVGSGFSMELPSKADLIVPFAN